MTPGAWRRPSVMQIEPVIPVVLGMHGLLSCLVAGMPRWPMAVFGAVVGLGLVGLLGWRTTAARLTRAVVCTLTPLVLSVAEPQLFSSLLQWYYCAVAVYCLVVIHRSAALLGPLAGCCYLVQVANDGAGDVPWGVAVLRAGVLASLGIVMRSAGVAFRGAQRDLQHAATHDDLTGLANRALLHERLAACLGAGEPVGLLLLDLDGFKEVNDSLGHRAGDALLAQVALRLQSAVRPGDTVARLGGDEFAVLLRPADVLLAESVSLQLREALQEAFMVDDAVLAIDASIGIAIAPLHAGEGNRLLQLADVAMYTAKRSGGGTAVYDAATDSHTADRLALLAELRGAMCRGELTVDYQPIVDAVTRRPVGMEALVRWDHPTRGRLQPDAFIPLAERNGVIGALTAFVLDAAVAQARAWHDRGLALRVSVNLSARDLQQDDLPQRVARVLARHGLDAALLELELTETLLMADPGRALRLLREIDQLGVSLAIDDFGTGMSSLAYLRDLPVQVLKIDKTFVTHLVDDTTGALVVGGVIDLAARMGLRTVAEGVESAAAGDLLADMRCTCAQGYFFSRPMPADAVEAWCRSVLAPRA